MNHVNLDPYLDVIKRRKKWVVVPLLIILPLLLLISFLQEPVYKSTATILIEPESPNIVGFQEILKLGSYQDYYQTQYRLIKSRPIIEKVVSILEKDGLITSTQDGNGLFAALINYSDNLCDICKEKMAYIIQRLTAYVSNKTEDTSAKQVDRNREKRLQKFQKSITVAPTVDTRLVDITIAGAHPSVVARQVDTLAEVYVAQNLAYKLETSRQASKWLDDLVEDLKHALWKAEKALQDFVKSHGLATIAELERVQNTTSSKASGLYTEYISTRIRRLDLESRMQELEQLYRSPQTISQSAITAFNDPMIATLQQRYVESKEKLTDTQQVFKTNHPKYVAATSAAEQLENMIRERIQQNINAIRTDLSMVATKEKSLMQELTKDKGKHASNEEDNFTNFTLLKNEVENKRSLYQDMLRRLNETNITAGLATNNIRIIQRGTVPVAPEVAWKSIKFVGSVVLTLSLGLCLAFLAEIVDRRFRNPEEVELYLQLPLVGMIPHYALSKGHGLRNNFIPFQMLQNHIQLLSVQQSLRSLLVTSALPHEGKSTTVVNLAVAFALLKKKVLLVDADLYNPSLHKIFNLPNATGLSDYLFGSFWKVLLQETSLENLTVLTSGSSAENLADIMDVRKIKDLIETSKEMFDIVIFDAPIILSIPDTTVLSSAIDGTLMVHRVGSGKRDTVLKAKQILEKAHAHIIGIVLNDIDKNYHSHEYYAYYQSRYKSNNNLLLGYGAGHGTPGQG